MAVSKALKNFNAGFGITYKSTLTGEGSTTRDNRTKLIASLPLVGVIVGIMIKKDTSRLFGKNSLLARGILCGSVVGMPIVLALDIIASISTQIHQARKQR